MMKNKRKNTKAKSQTQNERNTKRRNIEKHNNITQKHGNTYKRMKQKT